MFTVASPVDLQNNRIYASSNVDRFYLCCVVSSAATDGRSRSARYSQHDPGVSLLQTGSDQHSVQQDRHSYCSAHCRGARQPRACSASALGWHNSCLYFSRRSHLTLSGVQHSWNCAGNLQSPLEIFFCNAATASIQCVDIQFLLLIS